MDKAGSRIGFVGVGRMGANMARRLRDQGWRVTALHDASEEAARMLAAEIGAEAVSLPSAVTAAADIIVTVVSDDAAHLSIFSNSATSLLAGAAGRLFINCATLSPRVHAEAIRRARAAGASAIEACMASSIPQAR